MAITNINAKNKTDKNKFIPSKFFIADEKAIGFIGDDYTSFYTGIYSFSLFDTDIEMTKEGVKIRIKLFDAEGKDKNYTLYDSKDKSKTSIRAAELVDRLTEDYSLYTVVENNFNKAEALRNKFSK